MVQQKFCQRTNWFSKNFVRGQIGSVNILTEDKFWKNRKNTCIYEEILLWVLMPFSIELQLYCGEGPSWSWSHGSWIYNYLCHQCLSPLTLWVWIPLRRDVLITTLCDKVCQRLQTGRWFSPGPLVSSTNKTDSHDITEILLKVALNTLTLTIWWWLDSLADEPRLHRENLVTCHKSLTNFITIGLLWRSLVI